MNSASRGRKQKMARTSDASNEMRLEEARRFYAAFVTASAETKDERIERAFETVRREDFVGAGPWKVYVPRGYLETPSPDPMFVYQDVVLALDSQKHINNGQPSLHARCLDALELRAGDQVLHIGCGTGYYTALLAELVTRIGTVNAWDTQTSLVRRATENLRPWPNVEVEHRSGMIEPIPQCDVIYVNAGVSQPLQIWVDALAPAGRLLFPLTPGTGWGAMLLITRRDERIQARFVCRAAFIPCEGGQDPDAACKLGEAYSRGGTEAVSTLEFGETPGDEDRCWLAGDGWWLSTE